MLPLLLELLVIVVPTAGAVAVGATRGGGTCAGGWSSTWCVGSPHNI